MSSTAPRDGIARRRKSNGKFSYQCVVRRSGFPTRTKTFARLSDARAWKQNIEAEISSGKANKNAAALRLRLDDVIDRYIEEVLPAMKSAADKSQRLQWWSHQIGRVRLAEVDAPLIARTLDRYLQTNGVAGATANRMLGALAGLFKVVVRRWHLLQTNPCKNVERYPETGKRERTISTDEWTALCIAADELADEPEAGPRAQLFPMFLRLLYATGCRKSEALGLLWADVDFQTGRLVFRDGKNGADHVSFVDGDMIQRLLKHRDQFHCEGFVRVFPGRNPMTLTSMDEPWQRARARAGIVPDSRGEPLVMHSLRHSFCTEVARAGADLFELMAASGHKSIASAQRYIHRSEDQARIALQKRAAAR